MANQAKFEKAERRFFDSVGIRPQASFIDLPRIGSRARILEAGAGPPVLFVHGTTTAGASWANLVAGLQDFRCIMLDRPGCGLSELPPGLTRALSDQEPLADNLIADVLDTLDLPAAHVVSTSLGGWFAFRSAAAHPERVQRLVGMAFQQGADIEGAPLFLRVQAPPFMASVPVPKAVLKPMLKAAGMKAAIESGAFSDEMMDYMVSVINDTDTMRNELRTAPRPIDVRGRTPCAHSPELLQRVIAPVHLFWGRDDPMGGEIAAQRFADKLSDVTLELVPGAGHAPWLDAPAAAQAAVRTHLLS